MNTILQWANVYILPYAKQARLLYEHRQCYSCLRHLPEGQAVRCWHLGILLCRPCREATAQFDKDRSRSARGRFRKRKDILRLIRLASNPPSD
jgi:hypothetical protein